MEMLHDREIAVLFLLILLVRLQNTTCYLNLLNSRLLNSRFYGMIHKWFIKSPFLYLKEIFLAICIYSIMFV